MTLGKLRTRIEEKIEGANEDLAKFAADVTGQNPVHAMNWSRSAFGDAADIHVFSVLLRYVEALETRTDDAWTVTDAITEIDHIALQEMSAGCRASSTSATANLMERCIGEAWTRAWPIPPSHGFSHNMRRLFVSLADEG